MWTAETRALVGDFGAGQALSDEQYTLPAPLIPPARPGGRPRTADMRWLFGKRCSLSTLSEGSPKRLDEKSPPGPAG